MSKVTIKNQHVIYDFWYSKWDFNIVSDVTCVVSDVTRAKYEPFSP